MVNDNWANSVLKQARSQLEVANEVPAKWELSTELGAKGIRKLFKDNGIKIEVIYVPQTKIMK